MKFDEQGRVVWTPRELYELACQNPLRLVNGYLLAGTPWAFPSYPHYCDFLEALAERTGIHPKNFYLRGSCQIGFSIAPREGKVWTALHDGSDLDLVIVDTTYYIRFDQEVLRWEERNPADVLQDKASRDFFRRQQDRSFNCCRDEALPPVVCVHHQDTMQRVAGLAHCGCVRRLSAFIYPDWHSARRRYEYDLRKLRQGVERGEFPPPGDAPVQAEPSARGPRSNAPPPGQQG